jgi:hypothetical protein
MIGCSIIVQQDEKEKVQQFVAAAAGKKKVGKKHRHTQGVPVERPYGGRGEVVESGHVDRVA